MSCSCGHMHVITHSAITDSVLASSPAKLTTVGDNGRSIELVPNHNNISQDHYELHV